MMIPKIDSYSFGKIVVDGESDNHDVIILPDRVIWNWWRTYGHSLRKEDLQDIFDANPEVLIVGQGTVSRMKIPVITKKALEKAGIELIALPSQQACQRYNHLREIRKVTAAIHLTC
jgi:hypothetical protein